MSDNEKTLFESLLDGMWKRTLDDDSDEDSDEDYEEDEFGTLGCLLNELEVMFDVILFGLTPGEEEKKRNQSHSDHEKHALHKECAASMSTPHKNHSNDGTTTCLTRGSLGSNSGNFRSSEDITKSLSFRRTVTM